MLIHPYELSRFYGLKPNSILHIGAHHAEELPHYQAQGWGKNGIYWIESNPHLIPVLQKILKNHSNSILVEALVWHEKNVLLEFHLSSNSESSSILKSKKHSTIYPKIVFETKIFLKSQTLEDIWNQYKITQIDLINLDIQGSELHALKGLGDKIDYIKYIYSEINLIEMYESCTLFDEIKNWLSNQNFTLVDWQFTQDGWGDALWIRNDSLPFLYKYARIKRLFHKLINYYYSIISDRFKFSN